ncbi:MAG: hypothetical protein K1X61_04950 [Chitinophagales bacterium]|nr:hypothetical protein [Chitinophagales bacterium]
MKSIYLLLSILLICVANSLSQPKSDSTGFAKPGINLYLDGIAEYDDYIRKQIDFVNYVRDRHEANIHLLITTQLTGGGGREYTMLYIGQMMFAGKNDTLQYYAGSAVAEDEIRQGLVQLLKMGLMPYLARLPDAGAMEIEINFTEGESHPSEVKKHQWHDWVFTISGNCDYSGEQSYKNLYVNGGLYAKKTTEAWKFSAGLNGSYNYSRYAYDNTEYVSKTRSKSANLLVVKSITNHWSAGGTTSISASSYSNYDLQATLSPAIEWNLYPYSQSTSHLFTVLYQLTPSYADYTDTTIYLKTAEWLASQSLTASLDLIEKWGSVNMSLYASNYFHDFSKNALYLSGAVNLRIVKGLEFNLYGNIGFIHDQLSLPKEGATPEEVLTRQRELATDFNYYGSVGLSYSFGATYNNVVNARFSFLN